MAKIEFVSALHRRFRMREIDDTQLSQAIEGFEATLSDFQLVPLNALVIQDTEKWIKEVGKQHPIRTLDALHFCSFRVLAAADWHFVTVDLAFAQVVRSLDYSVINPMEA